MNQSVRRALITVADATTEGVSMVTVLAGAVLGAWAGLTVFPANGPSSWHIAGTGTAAVIGAGAVNGLTELVLTKARRRIIAARRRNPSPARGGRRAPVAPDTLEEGLRQAAAATEGDAAHRAANAAFRIDEGDNFLQDAARWRGYEDGEASFHLAPGVVLHYANSNGEYGIRKHSFTLLTSERHQPITITGVDQIRHHLAARAAGLPAAPITDGGDQAGAPNDGLTGLHATA